MMLFHYSLSLPFKNMHMFKQLITLIIFLTSICASIAQSAIYSPSAVHHPVVSKNGMVASQHELATQVGLDILKQGGNAVDAAVGVGFALAVVLPRAGNLGGGGFMLVHDANSEKTHAIDYREIAPNASSRDMYLSNDGTVDNDKFNQSYHSIGVPGTVSGMVLALEKYGTMSLSQVIAPAITLAENGFAVTTDLALVLKKYEDRLRKSQASTEIFYKGENYYEHGDILKQKDLAWSLKQISQHGADAFYGGKLGKKLSKNIRKNGGIITNQDLKKYEPSEVDPVKGSYRNYEIISMPPPSSGGIHLIQMLNILEDFPIGNTGHNSSETIHMMVESMRLAYADRSEHLGDPEFWDVPVDGLLSKAYAKDLREKINLSKAGNSKEINPGTPHDYESEETTHFSVIDKNGMAVSNTYTLNFSFGTGLVAKGTGILLNNEMGDFSAKPGEANAYGLIGGEANAVEAGKRPLSSMTPTMVFKDDEVFLVTGSPGGSRIITTVLQVIMNVIDHEMNIAEATHAPRIHHQWYPDILYYEGTLNVDTRNLLESKGHSLKQRNAMGSTQSIMLIEGMLYGCSDPRRPDAMTMGY